MPQGRRFGRIPAAFAAAGAAVVAIAGLSFLGVDWVRRTAALRDHTQVVLRHADDVFLAVREAEATQRGYFITGDARPVGRYMLARDGILSSLDQLRRLTADNPSQQARLERIGPMARRKVAQLEALMSTRATGDMAALARGILDARDLTDELRRELELFAQVERDLLVKREATLDRSLTLLALGVGSAALLAAACVAYAAWLMQRHRQGAQEQASEIRSLHDALAERARGLEEANRELEAFSYSVSHDLRAPLRHVQGYVELLERHAGEGLGDKGRRYLGVIADSARGMGQLIDDLLRFSRTGRVALHQSEVSLDAQVREAIRGLEMALRGREVEWVLADLPRVRGDAAMLRQVWANLLGNAVKYTRGAAPARIEVGAARGADGFIEVFVKDNGVGFDMAHAAKLFGVFQRLHRADQFEGTGIGLATVQRIVARHGGRIWAESSPGAGATFRFTLPAAGDSA